MKTNTKRRYIEDFTTLYYEKHDDNFKAAHLPQWISEYAHFLRSEIDDKMPEYYKTFRQGTVVMINFGVRIGSEISGPHFGVVLTRKDDKYSRNVLIAPLTSKDSTHHISIGQEIMERLSDKIKAEIGNSENILDDAISQLTDLNHRFAHQHFELEKEFFSTNHIDIKLNDLTLTVGEDNTELQELLLKIEKFDYSSYPEVTKFIKNIRHMLKSSDEFVKKRDTAQKNLQIINALMKKASHYNKKTFVNISKIRAKLSKVKSAPNRTINRRWPV